MRSAGHRLTLILLAFALLLRLLVPSGWMPSATGGAFAIEPCPAAEATGMVLMTSDHHHGDSHHSHKLQHDSDCAFSPFAGDFAATDVPTIVQVWTHRSVELREAPRASFFATGPPALLPPATGPPALA